MEKGREISLKQLGLYSLFFIVPQAFLFLISLWLGSKWQNYFEASPFMVAKILMVFFTVVVFFILIPYLRKKQSVAGIRYSILAFFVLGVGITLPGAISGVSDLIFHIPIYLASYILITFIYAPEVLGIEKNLSDWFKHHRQLYILLIYTMIVVGYVVGFGYMYFDMYQDDPASFSLSFDEPPGYGTFVYYSIVSFTTIGYGDIAPVSTAARMVTGFSSMLGMIINVVFIAILLIFVSGTQEAVIEKEGEALAALEKEEESELDYLSGSKSKKKIREQVKQQEDQVHHILNELRKL